MSYVVPIPDAQLMFPDYRFIAALTPSEQKAAFHVQDSQGTDLCLKIIAPNYRIDRIEREIIALQSLNHPNVARLVEYTFMLTGVTQKHYMVEEFVHGDDLKTILSTSSPWPIDRTCDFFVQLSDGLSALSTGRIVHRDLKPANIRVRPDGTPVIIDFGWARHLNLPDLTTTAEGAAIGTPIYFAPEQFVGTKHDIDHRTDLFALGILIYEALLSRHPFHQTGMDYDALKEKTCTSSSHLSSPDFLNLPHQMQLLLDRLLQKERVKRPANADHVTRILRRIGGAQ